MRHQAGTRGCFNTQPPEGGWARTYRLTAFAYVSTHSRPKAAGTPYLPLPTDFRFQHTAARRRLAANLPVNPPTHQVSTHSRPKAAGDNRNQRLYTIRFQHTAARRRLGFVLNRFNVLIRFQHTAARRRLVTNPQNPKATEGFNTQPPEGGWP